MKRGIHRICSVLVALCLVWASLPALGQEAAYDHQDSADLVIVGAGTAGISAAINAVENGAERVIVIEKMPYVGGCLLTSHGNCSAAVTKIQQEEGLTGDSYEMYKSDIMKEGTREGGHPNEALTDLYVENAGMFWDWMWDKGLKDYDFILDEEGHISRWNVGHNIFNYKRAYDPIAPEGSECRSGLGDFMLRLLEGTQGIEIVLNTEALHLVPNEKGQIVGVETVNVNDGTTGLYTSAHGILMATGGYASNPALIAHFNSNVKNTTSNSMPSSDGYGLYMMQEVGASFSDLMDWYVGYPCGIENPATPGRGYVQYPNIYYTGGIIVNKEGNRYFNETSQDTTGHELGLMQQPDTVEYHIWTDKIIQDMMKTSYGDGFESFFLQGDGAAYVKSADSIEELARQLGIDGENLKKTVESYNAHVESGEPDEFGRTFVTDVDLENLNFFVNESGSGERLETNVLAVNKVEGEKYYAVEVKAMLVMTMGGVNCNGSLQVLDMEGNAIPGLYAAGEVVGNVWGTFVSSGCGVMGALTFGHLAAENMLTLPMTEGYTVKNSGLLSLDLFEKTQVADDYQMPETLNDGVYTATVAGQNGPMEVEVVIQDGAITGVSVLSHNETPSISDAALAQIPNAIVEAGTPVVDSVSGCTLSSGRIIDGVKDCLEQAS